MKNWKKPFGLGEIYLVSALVLVAWLAVFLAAGIMRTVKTEVK